MIDSYVRYKKDFDEFEAYYFDTRNQARKESNIEVRIVILEDLIAKTTEFEHFCKERGLSKDFNDFYKSVPSSKGKRNLIKEDKEELKRCKLLQKLLKKLHKLNVPELEDVSAFVNQLKNQNRHSV
ncbi:hypothetical protein M3G15_09590 [Paenibacillus sp. p3-SID1389]|uniref:hypothetical protein n=1 Tax=Paenibacillus sp. p3-SID1389 TaxID=2916364 RepID=UPI0021A708D6|nr:hypothetical protein [Paenibacillus sp. p3-SID1389]MCT2195392.1 hypothetical protein [Paenibacillus sp. p3-SID1389]